ncbi:hypothetical protein B0H10DRAFT_461565 [Mycena sp. CBHHK59/15]|nr:hypothetical protein B0H10DRAFT_461565 [Mycena sp. CBHHK59/15]
MSDYPGKTSDPRKRPRVTTEVELLQAQVVQYESRMSELKSTLSKVKGESRATINANETELTHLQECFIDSIAKI